MVTPFFAKIPCWRLKITVDDVACQGVQCCCVNRVGEFFEGQLSVGRKSARFLHRLGYGVRFAHGGHWEHNGASLICE